MKNWIVFGCWFIGVTISFAQKNEETNSIAQSLTLEEFSKVAFDAYVYGLPLIEMEISKNKMTHPQYDGDKEWAPFGSFYHIRNFADPSQTRLRAPNVDVLYSGAWINLEQEPMVLFVPDAHDRYYSIQINDMYSNISGYIGRRTTGTKSGFYLLIGPNHTEESNENINGVIHVSTNETWIFPRTHCLGGKDVKKTHKFQDGIKIVPLSWFKSKGKKAFLTPYVQTNKNTLELDDNYGKLSFFKDLNAILRRIGMPKTEVALQAKFDVIGIGPNVIFNPSNFTAEQIKSLEKTAIQAEETITKLLNTKTKYGWDGSMDVGVFGENYFVRAMCARGGIGGNIAQEAYYPTAYYTHKGERLNGANQYQITFPKGAIPPVKAFWSLTLYDSETHCLIENPINRYAIRDIENGLQYNPDGSFTILIQAEAPKQQATNWLPSPKNKDFHLIFRAYQPDTAWFTEEYKLPEITKQ